MAGRPSKSTYNKKTATKICARIAAGESLRAICNNPGMPARQTVFLWMFTFKDFSDQYARACEARAETWAEEIIEIADDNSRDEYEVTERGHTRTIIDHDTINRSRLRVDSRKWIMSKLLPKKYGDKLTTESTGTSIPDKIEFRVTARGERINKPPEDDSA